LADGYYYGRRGQQEFVVSERNGTWGKAIGPPGLAALNAGGVGLAVKRSSPTSGSRRPATKARRESPHNSFPRRNLPGKELQ
jgi:hypothetical protein